MPIFCILQRCHKINGKIIELWGTKLTKYFVLQFTVWEVFMELNYIFRSNKQLYASTVASVPATFRLKRRNDLNPYRTALLEKLTVAQLAPKLSHYIVNFTRPKIHFPLGFPSGFSF